MAFGTPTSIGTKNDGSGSSCIVTTTANAEVGRLLVAYCSKDNVSDGATNEVTSVTDSTGANTWTKAHEYSEGSGGSDAGVTTAAFFCKVASQINSGGTVTFNFSSSKSGQVGEVLKLTCDNSVEIDGTPQAEAVTNQTNPGSLALSGLSNVEHIYVRVRGGEQLDANKHDWTVTAGYTATTAVLDTTQNMGMKAEYYIATGTGSTSNPGAASNDCDASSVFFALKETSSNGFFALL